MINIFCDVNIIFRIIINKVYFFLFINMVIFVTAFKYANETGCSSARLEYTSGGRGVASSNLAIPTQPAEVKH